MLREALSYPTRKPDGPRSVLIGGVLVFLSSVFGVVSALGDALGLVALLGLLPYLALRGYYVRVVRTTIGRDRPTPPEFDELGRLLRDGLASLVVSVLYLLPGVLVIGPLVYARAVETDLGTLYTGLGLPTALANAALSATGVLAMLAAMYLIGALYATPVAVARFAYEDRLRAAFDLRDVVDGALTEDYAVAWAISLLLQLLFLVAYPLRAALVGFFLHFVLAVGVRYCYGQGVGAGLDLEPVVPEPTEGSRAADTPGDSRTPPPAAPGSDPMEDHRPDPGDAASGSEDEHTTGRGGDAGAGHGGGADGGREGERT